ncbi:hypothetical protein TSOC_006003 [Tetrabaena socialis]|uniref:Uncharacterized protein n=1 Tax=Tetrabaena socialis TaxID=47790 RepID=A0A2J8A4U7_9CHLO|nr:hypothetical protein TSOC_006003 [Tetrabaena socialis]|eukprot:PNH07539.1 hypothetical protein TSOC_006003 [Tetrabaena socialis]
MAPFKFPLDAYVLAIPMAYAATAFCTMVARFPTVDPETSKLSYYEDESTSANVAQRYDNQFKQFFDARIKSHQTGVFVNWFEGTRQ